MSGRPVAGGTRTSVGDRRGCRSPPRCARRPRRVLPAVADVPRERVEGDVGLDGVERIRRLPVEPRSAEPVRVRRTVLAHVGVDLRRVHPGAVAIAQCAEYPPHVRIGLRPPSRASAVMTSHRLVGATARVPRQSSRTLGTRGRSRPSKERSGATLSPGAWAPLLPDESLSQSSSLPRDHRSWARGGTLPGRACGALARRAVRHRCGRRPPIHRRSRSTASDRPPDVPWESVGTTVRCFT